MKMVYDPVNGCTRGPFRERTSYYSVFVPGTWWTWTLHDFWSQVAIAALIARAHEHTEFEHGRWSALDTWWNWFWRV